MPGCLGRDPVGDVTVQLKNTTGSQSELISSYIIGDKNGAYNFDLKGTWSQWGADESYELEQVWLEKSYQGSTEATPRAGGSVSHVILDYYSLVTKTGKTRAVVYQRNMAQVNLAIDMEIDGVMTNIFTAEPHQ